MLMRNKKLDLVLNDIVFLVRPGKTREGCVWFVLVIVGSIYPHTYIVTETEDSILFPDS